ncbi:hypothetical protein YC2023_065797 [Brassica napus]
MEFSSEKNDESWAPFEYYILSWVLLGQDEFGSDAIHIRFHVTKLESVVATWNVAAVKKIPAQSTVNRNPTVLPVTNNSDQCQLEAIVFGEWTSLIWRCYGN